ncbi:MAG: sodium:proton antiporter [Candidatus Bathyarchaeia archaeon]
METIPQLYFVASAVVILIGVYSLVGARNMVKMVIGIELITSAVNLNFLALGYREGVVDPLAQSIVFTSIVIGAAVAAVALSLIIQVFKHYGTIDPRKLNRLRW